VPRYLLTLGGKPTEYFEVEQRGSSLFIRQGRIGDVGRNKVLEHDCDDDARDALEALTAKKLRTGFVPEGEPPPLTNGPADLGFDGAALRDALASGR